MAVTETTRLKLKKQDAGDQGWSTALNAGFDNADARFIKVSDDYSDQTDPNTPSPIDGDYIGQLYIDVESSPPRVWICTDATPSASVWERLNTTSIEAAAMIETKTVLEDILQEFQTRVSALEDVIPVPPRGHIDGLVLYWSASDTIVVAAGECADWSQTRYLSFAAAFTKTTASWVAGSGNGGLTPSQAPISPNTWYHVFVIYKNSGSLTDIGFDTSVSATNLLSETGYDLYRRLGSFKTDGSGNIIDFVQTGDHFEWKTAADADVTALGTGTLEVPPNVSVLAQWTMNVTGPYGSTSAFGVYVIGGNLTSEEGARASGTTSLLYYGALYTPGSEWWMGGTGWTRTDVNRQIHIRRVDGVQPQGLTLATLGWIDMRGKDL